MTEIDNQSLSEQTLFAADKGKIKLFRILQTGLNY